jgi:hypothetical protein
MFPLFQTHCAELQEVLRGLLETEERPDVKTSMMAVQVRRRRGAAAPLQFGVGGGGGLGFLFFLLGWPP